MSSPLRFNIFRLVARNLKKRPSRTIPAIIIFAILAATIFSAQYLVNGAEESLFRGSTLAVADIMVVPEGYSSQGETSLLTGKPAMFFFNDTGFREISRIPGVEKASTELRVATLSDEQCCAGFVQIVAFDPEHDFTLSPWLRDHGITMGKDDVLIGSRIESDVGSDILYYGHTFHVIGRLDPTGMRGVDLAVFTRATDAYTMMEESGAKAVRPLTIPPGMVSSVLVKVEPGASAGTVGEEIRKQIPGTKIITRNGLLVTVTGHLAGITGILNSATLAIALITIPLVGFISVTIAHERRREISLLGTLGVTREFIVRLLFAEGFSTGVIGGIAGIGIATVILVLFQNAIAFSFEIPFSAPTPLTFLAAGSSALFTTLVLAGMASLYPTFRVVRSDAYGQLSKEGWDYGI